MARFHSLLSLVQVFILHEGIVALDLDALKPPKGLKQVLQVSLSRAVQVKVDNEEGGGGGNICAASVLTALDLAIALTSAPRLAI